MMMLMILYNQGMVRLITHLYTFETFGLNYNDVCPWYTRAYDHLDECVNCYCIRGI
jgi:hypothetical protein